jgi:anti-anti-sigma regulatory factor
VTSAPAGGFPPRGLVRLLNTAGGRVLCLAGDVDEAAVDSYLRRYGREPARIDAIDAGSVTSLSAAALRLVRQHLAAAGAAGRSVALSGPPEVERERARAGRVASGNVAG